MAAVAAAEVVDSGGVCRDKYLLVNTERLALPSPALYPLCAPQTTCIVEGGTFDRR